MKRSNMMIIAVAAVVIAICAVATYAIYSDDGDEGLPEMRDPVLGDHYTYVVTGENQQGYSINYSYTQTLVGILEDGTNVVRTETSRGETDFSLGPIWVEDTIEEYEFLRTESVSSPLYGVVECDVYLMPYADQRVEMLYLTGTDTYVMQIEYHEDIGVQTILYDASTLGDVPDLGIGESEMADTVTAGDYYAYEVRYLDGEGNLLETTTSITYAESVEDGTVSALFIEGDQSTPMTVSTEGFIDKTAFDLSEGTGQFLLKSVTYGLRLCTLIEEDGIYRIVGVDDGIEYMAVMDMDGGWRVSRLIYSTMVSGDAWYGISDTEGESEVGDWTSYLILIEDGSGIRASYEQTVMVSDIRGDARFERYIDGDFVSTIEGLYTTIEGLEDTGKTETLRTPYGDRECRILTGKSTGSDGSPCTITWWSDIETEWAFKEVCDYGDITFTYIMTVNTMIEDGTVEYDTPIVNRYVAEGSFRTYLGYYQGEYSGVDLRVIGVEEGLVTIQIARDGVPDETLRIETEEEYMYHVPSGTLAGSAILRGYYNDIICDVYTYEAEGLLVYQYVNDGILFRISGYDGEDQVFSYLLYNDSNVY